MSPGKHVLLLDHAGAGRDFLSAYLGAEGYCVSTADSGRDLFEYMARAPADIVLLELTLPGEDGFSLVRSLRERHTCGVMFLTEKTDLADRVAGLEVGADDYVTKPCEPRELLARIRNVLRRLANTSANETAGTTALHEVAIFAHWQLDPGTHRLLRESGEPVDLTSGEFNLLNEFITKPGFILSREQLLQAVHNRNWDYYDRSIDVLVTRLRHKLETDPQHPEIIKTVRGAGYIFTALVKRQKRAA